MECRTVSHQFAIGLEFAYAIINDFDIPVYLHSGRFAPRSAPNLQGKLSIAWHRKSRLQTPTGTKAIVNMDLTNVPFWTAAIIICHAYLIMPIRNSNVLIVLQRNTVENWRASNGRVFSVSNNDKIFPVTPVIRKRVR